MMFAESIKPFVRPLGFALAITGGIATGGIGGVVAGLLSNIWAGEMADDRRQRLSSPLYAHPNHDLARLVADALASVFYRCAKDYPVHAGLFKELGDAATKKFLAIAELPALAQISSSKLPDLFQSAAGLGDRKSVPLLDDAAVFEGKECTVAWTVVCFLCPSSKKPPDANALTIAERAVIDGLFADIREMFKRNYSGDGRAYAALAIEMSSRSLALLADLARNQAEVLREQKVQGEQIKAIKTALDNSVANHTLSLSSKQTANLAWLLNEAKTISKTLNDVLFEVWLIREDTTAILAGQQKQATKDDVALILEEIRLVREALANKSSPAAPDQLPAVAPRALAAAETVRHSKEASALERVEAAVLAAAPEALEGLAALDKLGELVEYKRHQLRGDYHYFRGEFDDAVVSYEKAMELRPRDITARNNAAVALNQARHGNMAENNNRAIAIHEGTLAVVVPGSTDWAMAQNNLGNAWQNMPTGDRGENLQRAIEAYEAALTVRTKVAHPVAWAMTQNNLAVALAAIAELDGQDRCGLLRRAIAAGKGALTIRTAKAMPHDHASTSRNLQIDREAYEAAGCGSAIPFDDIEPAQ